MTLASEIIGRAYRESNLVALAGSPNASQLAEGLSLLNGQLLAALGHEAGEELCDLDIGGAYDQSPLVSQYIPANARLVLNLAGARSLKLHPQPYDGQRLAITDAAGNLAAANLTLSGNGRKIEGAASLILNTNGEARQWLYRADASNWVKIASLLAADAMPLPEEFDGFFITRLAIRLNPRYGQGLAEPTIAELVRAENKLRARYRKPRRTQDMGSLGLLGSRRGASGLGQADFEAGRPFW